MEKRSEIIKVKPSIKKILEELIRKIYPGVEGTANDAVEAIVLLHIIPLLKELELYKTPTIDEINFSKLVTNDINQA